MKRTVSIPTPVLRDWRWPLTWRIPAGTAPPFELWILWHRHCLLPQGTA